MFQEIADALQAPKRFLWSMVPGLHDADTGEAYTGSQVAHNAFGTDPDSFWGKALGFGLDVAGDPLSLLAPMAARGIGAGIRGLGLAGDAAAAGEGAVAGVKAAAPAAEAGGVWNSAIGAADTPTVAMRNAADLGGITDATGSLGGSMGPNYSNFKNLRGQFGMLKNIAPIEPELVPAVEEAAKAGELGRRALASTNEEMPWIGNYTGPRRPLEYLFDHVDPNAQSVARVPDSARYLMPQREMGMGFAATPENARHEIVHGLIDTAIKSGDTASLPLSMRVPANLLQSQSPFVRGVGGILNEAAAHGAESRSPMGQLGKYLDLLLAPHPEYHNQIAQVSPLAANVWQGSQYAWPAALAAGAGAAAAPFLGDR